MNAIRKRLILIGDLEGVSYLILLLIAMPMKYMFDMPSAVRIVGSLHGILFVAFSLALLQAYRKLPLPFNTALKIFILSFIPFGTFYIKRLLPAA